MSARIVEWTGKPPIARLDFSLDLSGWLAQAPDDPVTTATVRGIEPTGITATAPDISHPPLVTVWIEGGVHGTRYAVDFLIETGGGRTDEIVALLPVIDPLVDAEDRVGPDQVGG